MTTEQPVDPQAVEETKQQIRSLVGEITQLSRQNLEPTVFYGEFLQRVITALAAVGGAVWTRGNESGLELSYQINLRQSMPEDQGEDQLRHARLLHRVVNSGEEMLVPPYSGAAGDEEAGNPTGYLLVLAPIRDDENIAGVIEVFQRPTSGPASQRGYLRFLSEMCVLVGDYLKGRRLRKLTDWQSLFTEADRFSRTVHESLNPKTTAFTIANEGRRLIGCDRVSVAIRRGRKGRIEAVSGQDLMDRRSNVVTQLNRLTTAVMRSGETLWYTGSTDDLPPQIESALQEYVDESHSKSVAVVPLRRVVDQEAHRDDDDRELDLEEGEVIGALVIEQIEDTRPPEAFSQSMDLVSEHSERALSNAIEHNSLFLMPLWRTIGRAQWIVQARTLPKTLAIATLVVAAIIAMCTVPYKFTMKAEGELQPMVRRYAFADIDGQVNEVLVSHGDPVKEGDPLALMINHDLSIEITKIRGQIDTTRQDLRRVESTLGRGGIEPQSVEHNRLAAESTQLRQQLLSLAAQLKLLTLKNQSLRVTSSIDGIVEDFEVEKKLLGRPVKQGDVLLTIADPSQGWELEVYMPENRMGHLAKAVRDAKAENRKLPLTFVVANAPGEMFHFAKIREIQGSAELYGEHGQSVRINIDVDEDELVAKSVEPKPGISVTAKIECGKRPIGYVWFREAIEFVQTRLLF